MSQQYVTREEFDRFAADQNLKYEQARKLITAADLSLKEQIDKLSAVLTRYMNTPPSPEVLREFWVKQIPRIKDDIRALGVQLGELKSLVDKLPGGTTCRT